MSNKPTLEQLLSYTCKKIHGEDLQKKLLPHPSEQASEQACIHFLLQNRLDVAFSFDNQSKLNDFPLVREFVQHTLLNYHEFTQKMSNSLSWLAQQYPHRRYSVIKTFSSYPHTTSDIDVLIEDDNDAAYPIHIKETNLWPLHIQNKISWLGAQAVSNEYAWAQQTKKKFFNTIVPVPNDNLDYIIRMGHIPFEVANIKLGELLHIYRLSATIDTTSVEKEVQRMKWDHTYGAMKHIIDDLRQYLYKKTGERSKYIRLPYHVPLIVLLRAVIEKKAWRKIFGARFIIKDRLTNTA